MNIIFAVLGSFLFVSFLGRGLLLDACKTYPLNWRRAEALLWIAALGGCVAAAVWPLAA